MNLYLWGLTLKKANIYENILIMGDLNTEEVEDVKLHSFCSQWKLKSLNKDLKYYKHFISWTCIYLFLPNSGKSFESTCNGI